VSAVATRQREIEELSARVDERQSKRDEIAKGVIDAESKRLRELNAERKTDVAVGKQRVTRAAEALIAAQDEKVETMRAYVAASKALIEAEQAFRAEARKLDHLTGTAETVEVTRGAEHRPDDTKARPNRTYKVTRRGANPLVPIVPSLKARAAESTDEGWKLRGLFNELRDYARGL